MAVFILLSAVISCPFYPCLQIDVLTIIYEQLKFETRKKVVPHSPPSTFFESSAVAAAAGAAVPAFFSFLSCVAFFGMLMLVLKVLGSYNTIA